MREEIEKVLEAMREDYRRWSDRCAKHDSYAHYSDVKNKMEENYCNGLEVEENRRYWKITSTNGSGTQRSVAGFIAKAGDKKFREGDMLKGRRLGMHQQETLQEETCLMEQDLIMLVGQE